MSQESMGMGRRALLTESERETIQNPETKDNPYVAVSRVRTKIEDELPEDVEILREHRPDLLEDLQEIVCTDSPQEGHSTPAERSPVERDVSPEPTPEPRESEPEPRETITEQQAKDVLEGADVTGRGAETKEVRRKAILHAWRELREKGEATTQELANSAFDEYSDERKFGYGESSNHYRGYTFWDSCAREVFKQLPGVDAPEQRGNTWYFTGE
ncbi:hypothetical protein [Natrialba sp. INN-245]|uniref:hypothetical protein n=1 Tax=Natrialba sp. INN-245 TaxID=2690967 RepID=UPI00190F5C27|nr:hypothetical protein [Natrialba sp. INN-245]